MIHKKQWQLGNDKNKTNDECNVLMHHDQGEFHIPCFMQSLATF